MNALTRRAWKIASLFTRRRPATPRKKTRLGVEALEGRDVPAVYTGTFGWEGPFGLAAAVSVTVEEASGQYLWEYRVENIGFEPAPGQGVGMFIVQTSSPGGVGALASSAGWDGYVGILGGPEIVHWQNSGPPELGDILVGQAGTFSFTTPVVPVVTGGGQVYDSGYAIGAGGQLAVPGQPAPSLPVVTVEAVGDAAEGGDAGTFQLTRTGDLSQPLTVTYTVGAETGAATGGADYTSLTGTATFEAWSATATVTVTPAADNEFEDPETVTVLLADPGAGGAYAIDGARTAVLTITDDPPQATATATWESSSGSTEIG